MPTPTLPEIQANIKRIYELASKLPDIPDDTHPRISALRKLEELTVKYESGVVELRNYCERKYRAATSEDGKPLLIPFAVKGRVEVNEYGWLHIKLDALLPHCRYATPTYLSNTITRLLNDYEGRRGKPCENTEAADFKKRIGSTVYTVSVHFSRTSRETIEDKILRQIESEARKTA